MRRAGALLLLTLLVLPGCFGKVQMTMERRIDPAFLAPSATFTEVVRLSADGAFGEGLKESAASAALPIADADAGWKVTDTSQGSTFEISATRSFSGSEIFAIRDDASVSTLGRSAIRVTDLIVARRYEVRIALPSSSATADSAPGGASAEMAKALADLVAGSIVYDHIVVMPGFVTGHDASEASGSTLTWHVDPFGAGGQILHAESLYVDAPRIVLIALLLAVLVVERYRRSLRTPV